MRVPWSFGEITNSSSFLGTVDGFRLTSSALAIDPYTSESQLFIHFLINKNRILQIVSDSPQIDKQGTMRFTLAPTNVTIVETSTSIISDTGKVEVSLSWNPSQLSAGITSELVLNFYDQFTDVPISEDIKYDFFVYSSGIPERIPIIGMADNIAHAGADKIGNIVFPQNGVYDIEIDIKEVSTRASDAADTSRAGKARGVVVVPEFETIVGLLMGLSMLSVVLIIKYMHMRSLESNAGINHSRVPDP